MRALDVSGMRWSPTSVGCFKLHVPSYGLTGVCVCGSGGHSKLRFLKAPFTCVCSSQDSLFSIAEQLAHRPPHAFLYYYFKLDMR